MTTCDLWYKDDECVTSLLRVLLLTTTVVCALCEKKSLTGRNCKTCGFSFYELFYFHLRFHFHSSFFILAEAKARAKAQARRHISISVAGVFPLTWTKETVGATKDPSV